MVLGVVPREEVLAVRSRVLPGAEALGEVRPVLERLELSFRERVVVGDVRPRVRLGDAEVGQQERHGLRRHRRAAVSVKRELAGLDSLARAGLAYKLLREGRALVVRDHPAHDVAAENVEDHVQVEVRPLRRTEQLRDVPAPHLVRAGGQQLGLLVLGVSELIAPLTDFAILVEDAVHRPERAEVLPLVEQLGVDLSRSQIYEARLMHDRQDALPLRGRKRPYRGRTRRWRRGLQSSVVRGARQIQACAQGRNPKAWAVKSDGLHHESSLSKGRPSSAATFFWTSTIPSARSARAVSRVTCRSSSTILLSRGSGGTGLRPRVLGASPANSPRSRACRQVVRWEEYSPSDRRSAPISPACVHASALRRISCLYLAVNCRRLPFAATSTSSAIANSAVAVIIVPLLALYTNFQGGSCLTHVGTEGARGWCSARRASAKMKGSFYRQDRQSSVPAARPSTPHGLQPAPLSRYAEEEWCRDSQGRTE